jgi:plastocyanin
MARTFSAALLLVAALAAAGCGGSAATTSQPPAVTQVEMPPSYRFEPPVIRVPAGATVTWVNTDHFTHSVQVTDGPVHMVKPGEHTAITFDAPGEYLYICTLHPHNMKGTVVVTGR